MILKERNAAEHPETDKWSVAGAKAEEQMAFYLRRMFLNDKDIYVFNDLRYKEDTGDSAQIDHLILHRHGFIIVESKSVSTSVAVNKHGEWVRYWDGKPQGMPSPIQQAKYQAEFLKRALGEHENQLGTTKLFGIFNIRFKNCPFEFIVAISDHGSIKRDGEMPEVMKADQVADKIKDIFIRHKKASNIFSKEAQQSLTDGTYNFKDEEMQKIAAFLTKYHYTGLLEKQPPQQQTPAVAESDPDWKYKPKPPVPAVERPTPPPLPTQMIPPAAPILASKSKPVPSAPATTTQEPAALGKCEKCGSQCVIKWGKFSYYWKCPKCDHNMAIKEYCQACKRKLMLRKQKTDFYIYCEVCGNEHPYYHCHAGSE